MGAFRILLRKELSEGLRTRRVPVVLALFFLIGMAAPLLARFTPDIVAAAGSASLADAMPTPTAADAVLQFVKLTGQLGAFVAILLAMGTVAAERDRGTAVLVLTKPVGRPAYLASKMVALAVVLLAASVAAGVAATFYTAVLFEPLSPAGAAVAIALTWVGLLVPAAVTFLGSVIGPSPAVAAGIGFAWVALTGLLSALPSIGSSMPSALAGHAQAFALGISGAGVGSVGVPLAVSLSVLAAAALIAWRAFDRQEL